MHHAAYNPCLDGLRGIAALFVFFTHFFYITHFLDPSYQPSSIWGYLDAAHQSVLLFFILSGYVIGLTNKTAMDKKSVKDYVKRRLVRIYPIYIAAIIVTLIAFPDPVVQIVGNLLFLQNYDGIKGMVLPPLTANPPLWSLNYEVLYYGIFLLVWWRKPRFVLLVSILTIFGFLQWLNIGFQPLIASYSIGLVFWLSGLYLAWEIPTERVQTSKEYFSCLSLLLLLIALENLQVFNVLLKALHFQPSYLSIVNFSDLLSLPVCLALIATVTNKKILFLRWGISIVYILVCLLVLYLGITKRLFHDLRWLSGAVFAVASLIVGSFKMSNQWLSIFSALGKLSFAIYVMHHPIIVLVRNYFPFQGTAGSFLARALCVIILTLIAAYILEAFLQPKLKKLFWPPTRHFLQKEPGKVGDNV
jgi:peptidoglycan/LPS O-acetylase OafA/YrhL